MLGVLLATVTVGGACGLGYSSMAPGSQFFGRTFVGNPARSRQIALTYDDGPNESHTLALLEVLEKEAVPATFFMLGRQVEAQPRVALAVARAGHVIGNHTYDHPNLIFSAPAEVRRQILECRQALHEVVGEHSRLFRPPFGGRRPDVLSMVRQLGLEPVMWSVAGSDWNPLPPEQIAGRISRRIRGGDVVLLHDGSHHPEPADRRATVMATKQLIRRYREQGFAFVTVPEMMLPAPSA